MKEDKIIKLSDWWRSEDVKKLQDLLDSPLCVFHHIVDEKGNIDFFAFGKDLPYFDREIINIIKSTPKEELEQLRKLSKLKTLKKEVEELEKEIANITTSKEDK